MKPICKNCYYWRWNFIKANNHEDDPYDNDRSFCGLHGCCEIDDPNKPIDFDLLNGGVNDKYPNAHCGFYPRKNLVPIQLSLF